MKYFIILISIFTLTGCATGAKFVQINDPNDNMSMLYIYRSLTWINSGMAPNVYINDNKLSKLYNGGYQVYQVEPGIYNIFVDASFLEWSVKVNKVSVNLLPNTSAYIRLVSGASLSHSITYVNDPLAPISDLISNGGYATITDARLEIVSKKIAETELLDTRLSME